MEGRTLTPAAPQQRTSSGLGTRLRQLRVAAGLTQSDLAGDRVSKEYVPGKMTSNDPRVFLVPTGLPPGVIGKLFVCVIAPEELALHLERYEFAARHPEERQHPQTPRRHQGDDDRRDFPALGLDRPRSRRRPVGRGRDPRPVPRLPPRSRAHVARAELAGETVSRHTSLRDWLDL